MVSRLRWARRADDVEGGDERYTDSWRDPDVAAQMVALTRAQLKTPERVAPYVALRRLLAPLVERGDLPHPARLLEIGAGAGAYGELLERWWPGRFVYTGADYADEVVTAARGLWPGRTVVRRDLFDPGALDGFDVVLASAVVDVRPDPCAALAVLLDADAPWIVLHRQRVDRTRTYAVVAGGYRGQRTYSSHVSRADLDRLFTIHGRRVEGTLRVERDVRSFLLRRA